MSRARRGGAALVATGLLFAGAAVSTLQATPVGAVEFSSYDLRAGARGTSFYNDDASGARQGEGTVPETQASLQNGPVGLGLATVAYPGPLASNAGTLLLVLQPGCTVTAGPGIPSGATPLCPLPESAKQLNNPIKAEARSGQDPPTTNFNEVPGTELSASAKGETVTADARVNKAISQPGTFGTTTAHSEVAKTVKGGEAKGNSKVQDINLGAGAITIESVISTASAITDGTKADGAASTTVNGLKIGGQPATIDEKGLRIGTADQPVNAVANQIAQQALSQSGFQLFVSTPQKEVSGASATVTAGSLLITQKSESGVTGMMIGGAQASVVAAPGLGEGVVDLDSFGTVGGSGSDFSSGGSGSLGGISGGGSDFSAPSTGSSPSPVAPSGTTGGATGVAVGPTTPVSSKGQPITPGTAALAVVGTGLFALGMRRLSSDVLVEKAATSCPLEAT